MKITFVVQSGKMKKGEIGLAVIGKPLTFRNEEWELINPPANSDQGI